MVPLPRHVALGKLHALAAGAAIAFALGTLAATVGEEPDTIEEVYEPYLMQLDSMGATVAKRIAARAEESGDTSTLADPSVVQQLIDNKPRS